MCFKGDFTLPPTVQPLPLYSLPYCSRTFYRPGLETRPIGSVSEETPASILRVEKQVALGKKEYRCRN
jgi:hypothetical protein